MYWLPLAYGPINDCRRVAYERRGGRVGGSEYGVSLETKDLRYLTGGELYDLTR